MQLSSVVLGIVMAATTMIATGASAGKKVYVDRMDGFEVEVTRALHAAEAPVMMVDKASDADYLVKVDYRRQGSSRLLYLKQTGRRDSMALMLEDRAGRQIASIDFDGFSLAVADRFSRAVTKVLRG